jgi:ADP-ribose pyrophosphatase YjhB (NUDIX family)
MILKIFYKEKPIYIVDELTAHLKEIIAKEDVIFTENVETNKSKLLKDLSSKEKTAAVIFGKDFEKQKAHFCNQFEIIEAAGGIVQNEFKDLLFIYRLGKWDLPKGKLEKNENLETCAQREVEEETAIVGLVLKKKVSQTYHIYKEHEKDILKISHWYHFTCPAMQNMIPQTIEGITEVKWIPTQNIKEPIANTYGNIKEILSTFFDTA